MTWQSLTECIQRIADGDLAARASVHAGSADAEAAAALNRIVERLQGTLEEHARVRKALAAGQAEQLAFQRRLGQAERLAALGALAARLAHELGTPLHSIAGHLDLMLSDPRFPSELEGRGKIVAGEVDRLCALIRSHLKRLRSPTPETEPTDLNQLIRKIAGLVQPVFDSRSIRVSLDLHPEAGRPFACDPSQVAQVVMNLVQNALDAMPGGGNLVLRTAVTEEQGRAISVSDSGCGVPPEVVERAFEPFFTTKRAGRGTGLGLSLCREIARNHGGDIVLDSQLDHGTVVTLTLGTGVEAPA